jgi:sulfur dioxygenase
MYFRIRHDDLMPHEPALLATPGRAHRVQRQGGSEVRQVNDGDVLPFGHELVCVLTTTGRTTACLSVAWRDRQHPRLCGTA